MTLRLGWLSSGRDKAARDLLAAAREAIDRGELDAEIVFVFCSRERGEDPESDLFLDLAQAYHIPSYCLSFRRFRGGRLEYDRRVTARIEGARPALCVLAGYMLIAGEEMCRRLDMINLHPAAPGGPAGSWQDVVWQLIQRRATTSGVMMHLVTPELDRGPVAAYCTYSLCGEGFDPLWAGVEGRPFTEVRREGEGNALFQAIRRHGLAREFPLIISTLKAFAQGQVRIEDKQVRDANGRPIPGCDLTAEIEAALAAEGRR